MHTEGTPLASIKAKMTNNGNVSWGSEWESRIDEGTCSGKTYYLYNFSTGEIHVEKITCTVISFRKSNSRLINFLIYCSVWWTSSSSSSV